MKNLKRDLLILALGLAILLLIIYVITYVIISVVSYVRHPYLKEEVSQVKQMSSMIKTSKEELLQIVIAEKKYQPDYDVEAYEVIIKNISGDNIYRAKFSIGGGVYELYSLLPNEEYKLIALNSENVNNIDILSVDYQVPDIVSDETEISMDGIKGYLLNTSQERSIYPIQIIYFVNDENGYIVQKNIEYEGCLFEELIISSGEKIEFEIKGKLLDSKPVIVKYSGLDFQQVHTNLVKK